MQGRKLVLLLVVLYGSAFIAGFNENLMNMALMSIMRDYSIDSVTAQWLVTGYMIVATIMVMCMAYLFRKFRLRPLYFAAAVFTLVGSVMGFMAQSYEVLLVSRLIAAIGSGIFIPLMMNTILIVTPKNKLGTYLSIGGCMITFGPALAPVVCGALVTSFGWHSIFVTPIAATIVFAVLALPAVQNLEKSADAPHLDYPSVGLSVIALSALSIGLAELTLIPGLAIGLLVVAIVGAAVFIYRQFHCDHPLIDLTPMRSSAFWPSILLTTVAMMGSFSSSVLLPLYFEGATGLTAFIAGMILLVPVLGNAGCTLLGGRIMDKRGEWPLLPAGFAAIALGFTTMVVMAPTLSLPAMFAAAFVVYAGTGFVMSPSQTAGLRTLPPHQNPHGVALSTTFIQIAACIGPSLYTGILASQESSALAAGSTAEVAAASGFATAMIVAAVIAALGCVLALVYSRQAVARASAAAAARSRIPAGEQPLHGLMKENPYTLPVSASVRVAMQALTEHRVGGIPLVDRSGKPVGFVTDGDIMRFLADQHPAINTMYSLVEAANSQTFDERLRELLSLPISSIATSQVVVLDASASLEEACNLLSGHKLKKVPVVRDNKIIGTLNRSDILRFAMERSLAMDEH